ncbi:MULTISPECIES: pentapeptide repeat-containing protein [unclassified Streptomyces]|uniref:pentapeptide repeat-containing protein n=1 Tax=unclassified Streptomyces TaxID=2593676 RepID=UPI0033AFC93A
MTHSSTEPTESLYCGRDATARDRGGCRGRRVPGHEVCLAHLDDTGRDAYLERLEPGADIDHRGTPFTQSLLEKLLKALRDPTTGNPRFGSAKFSGAQFCEADFSGAQFSGNAKFSGAQFSGDAKFNKAQFSRNAWFGGAQFSGDASFHRAQFPKVPWFGPVVCAKTVVLSEAVFEEPVTLEIAARNVHFERTRWGATATVRLRYATANLDHAVLTFPVMVTYHPALFLTDKGKAVGRLRGVANRVRVESVRGVDAAHLVLADVDLTDCLFTGAFHLDQLRLEGRCTFASVPSGLHWRRWYPVRFTPRRTLAEEHHWRANQAAAVPGWKAAPEPAGPAQLAPAYRALRKAFEDGKNEPGAADFYYGEMEMRRHDRTGTIKRAERALLYSYWMLSGYGLRASRALCWLAAAMLVTIVLLMAFGLPKASPEQQATGTVPPAGGKVTLKIDKTGLENPTLDGDWRTLKRFEKALNVTVNSVVFRSSGQDLTTAGTYIEMASRVTEPILLGLAVLAVRSRVKR